MENSAKILLLGQTGVGKSSFINYFLGKEELALTGAGKPVTQELTAYEVEDGRYPIEIFDSKGIEAETAYEQKSDIIAEIKKRNNSDDVFNWFHTIFYCVSAEKKFQNFEAQFIKEMQGEISQHIHIILTKCDSVEPEIVNKMKNAIKEDLANANIAIFEVVSVNDELLDGTVVEQRGKEALSEQVFRLLWEDIADKLSSDYARSLHGELVNVSDNIYERAIKLIDEVVSFKSIIGFLKDEDKANGYLNELFDDFKNGFNEAVANADRKFNEILKPAAKLYSSYKGVVTDSFVDDVDLTLNDWNFEEWFSQLDFINDEKELMKVLAPNLVKKGFIQDGEFINTDDLSFGQLLKVITSGVGDLITLNPRLKKLCKGIYEEFVASLPSESELQEEAYKRIIDYVVI